MVKKLANFNLFLMRALGVDIIAILQREGKADQVVLVSQFRPPLNAVCLEFPAGLITEASESAESAAFRELYVKGKKFNFVLYY